MQQRQWRWKLQKQQQIKRKQRQQRRQLCDSAALELAAVWRRQCVISAAVAGSSTAAMFPLFITHDEYFVRCGGSGGGYYDVFDLSSYELLNGQK
jgi:hypothetical protein